MSQSFNMSQSPFLNVTSFSPPDSEIIHDEITPLALPQSASPFVSVYEMENGEGRVDPESEEFVQFLNELYDEEFDEAVFELINEASGLYDDNFVTKYRDPTTLDNGG